MPNNKNKNNKRWAILSGIAIQMGVTIYLFTNLGAWLDLNFFVGFDRLDY